MRFASFVESYMMRLVNQERAAVGLPPLQLEMNLSDAADDHTDWMISADTFSHTGVNGTSAHDRIVSAGFDIEGAWRTGENLAGQTIRGPEGLRDDVLQMHEGLMDSPGHRANILNPDFTHIGIGISTGDMSFGTGTMYESVVVTQTFGTTQGTLDLDLFGTNNNDNMSGQDGNDLFRGFDGDDVVRTWGGNDTIIGGDGDDTAFGGTGDDLIHGRVGDDELSGNIGNDRIVGGVGNDHIMGSVGNDALMGGTEHDTIEGGHGRDRLEGQGGFDRLNGGMGNDVISGGRQADTFIFDNNFGNDRITDFDVANRHERIDLSGVDAITSFDDLMANHVSQANGHALISDGAGNTIRLDNVNIDALSAGDFIF